MFTERDIREIMLTRRRGDDAADELVGRYREMAPTIKIA